MQAGGTLDLPALTNDLNQVTDGNYATTTLIKLMLINSFSANTTGVESGQEDGGLPLLSLPSGQNPMVNQLQVQRVNLPQPANSIQLVWHCIDTNGNYACSYPINAQANHNNGTIGGGSAGFLSAYDNEEIGYWAYGWIRLNGQGIWWPMSLLPSIRAIGASNFGPTAVTANQNVGAYAIEPFGGMSSISGPIAFFDWIGYWDGRGDTVLSGDNTPNAYLLAVLSTNLSTSSPGQTLGANPNYAVPNSSGRAPGQQGASTAQKAADILVNSSGTTGCD
jgi:hypothetical protein